MLREETGQVEVGKLKKRCHAKDEGVELWTLSSLSRASL